MTTGRDKANKANEDEDCSGYFARVLFYDGSQSNGDGYTREKIEEGHPKTSGYIKLDGGGKFDGNPYVHIYKYRIDDSSDKELQTREQIYSTCAHEFGHVFGLMDAYGLNIDISNKACQKNKGMI